MMRVLVNLWVSCDAIMDGRVSRDCDEMLRDYDEVPTDYGEVPTDYGEIL